MIIALSHPPNGAEPNGILIVLEPGNVARLMQFRPMSANPKMLGAEMDFTISICYSPDAEFVRHQVQAGVDIIEAIVQSQALPPNLRSGPGENELERVEVC